MALGWTAAVRPGADTILPAFVVGGEEYEVWQDVENERLKQ